ncbi:DUF4870 domain-containing protein [Sunxiuqinia indica]|uniref:DUF4870 domain-containing protein n=1 Tax=Sunxiuqinia indica TaxID=2692584 RepID=UPI001359FFEC|nr:DUF4870 domain-containing protein [Sunxiuqinia indica]
MNRNLEDLEKLDDLRKKGIITEDEFNKEKDSILNDPNVRNTNQLGRISENTYSALLHFSLLLGAIHLLLGLIAPLLLWVIIRTKDQNIDRHGKNIINWLISLIIYTTTCIILVMTSAFVFHFSANFTYKLESPFSLFTGLVPVTILMILNVVFILIGGIKASQGQIWRYPLAINFFKNNRTSTMKQ